MTRYDFQAVNARGIVLRTFDNLQTARKWAREHASEHDGLCIQSVVVTVRTQVVYRPKSYLQEVA